MSNALEDAIYWFMFFLRMLILTILFFPYFAISEEKIGVPRNVMLKLKDPFNPEFKILSCDTITAEKIECTMSDFSIMSDPKRNKEEILNILKKDQGERVPSEYFAEVCNMFMQIAMMFVDPKSLALKNPNNELLEQLMSSKYYEIWQQMLTISEKKCEHLTEENILEVYMKFYEAKRKQCRLIYQPDYPKTFVYDKYYNHWTYTVDFNDPVFCGRTITTYNIKKSDNGGGYDVEELNFYPDLKDGETCEIQKPKLKQYTKTPKKYIRECISIDIN